MPLRWWISPLDAEILIETEFGPIEIDLSKPLLTLARNICLAETPEAAEEVLRQPDSQLDDWEPLRRTATSESGGVVLPFGVELRIPSEFEPRR
jgi:hypothetical protein